jgi:hypothetical protein
MSNAWLQLRRAITIQAEGIRPLEKLAIALSAARLIRRRVERKPNDWLGRDLL